MEVPDGARGRPARPRLALVSLHAHRPMAPRGERTRRVRDALAGEWDVELVAPAEGMATGGAAGGGSNRARRLAARVVNLGLLDKWEPWSIKTLARWQPKLDAALLIGHPYSPLVYAAQRLRAAGVPYVVDVGDPWALTAADIELAAVARHRARRAELALWRGAAGGVFTTEGQAEAIAALVPELSFLVRPNGYDEIDEPAPAPARDPQELRLVHLGMLNSVRLDPRPLLAQLAASGFWRRIVLSQFGDDFVGFLDDLPAGIELERRSAEPWQAIVDRCGEFDLGVVVGNVNADQLPSKAVQYLTLPLPRLALARPGDALATYVADKPGWLTVAPQQADAAAAVAAHLERRWDAASLRPPQGESWPAVASRIAAFVSERARAGRETRPC